MKIGRHTKILELLNQYDIETQEDLAAKLQEAGYPVTQATVSRDIRQLNLTKVVNDKGRSVYSVLLAQQPDIAEKYARVFHDGFISMDVAENLLVIRTVPGMAMAMAAALDSFDWKEVLGCIAGDDTIMCAIKTSEQAVGVMEKLKKILTDLK